MRTLRRLDEGLARGEAALAAAVLLTMVFAAATQAFFRNLTDFGVDWANEALSALQWIDPLLKKGTVWLAFLGASLAAYHEKHIAIDVLSRVAPPTGQKWIRFFTSVVAGISALGLAAVFWIATLQTSASEQPFDYQVLVDGNAEHVCDVSDEELARHQVWREGCLGSPEECREARNRPSVFCGVRAALSALGAHHSEPVLEASGNATGEVRRIEVIGSPESASHLMMPLMFLIIGGRFLARGLGALSTSGTPTRSPENTDPEREAHSEESQ